MNKGWLVLFCIVSLIFAIFSRPDSGTSHKLLDAIITLFFGVIGATSMIMLMIICIRSPYEGNAQLIDTEVLESYTFDTSLPFSVKINEVSGTPTTVVVDGYLSENDHFSITKPHSKIKVFTPKEDESYMFEKVTATYRCTLWLFYNDKTRTEYHLYVPEEDIKKEVIPQ